MGSDYRSIGTLAGGTRTNSTIPAPSGIIDGDILIITFYIEGGATPTPPSGFDTPEWSRADSTDFDTWIWWKRARGESGNYTVTHSSSFTEATCVCALGGAKVGKPEDPAPTNNKGTTSTASATGLTPTIDSELIIYVAAYFATGSTTPPTGSTPTFTERYDAGGDLNVCTGVLTPPAATGAKTQAVPGGEWTAHLISVKANVVAVVKTFTRPFPYLPGSSTLGR